MRIRAGLRGQPEWQLEYARLRSVTVQIDEDNADMRTLFFQLDEGPASAAATTQSQRQWSSSLLMCGIPSDEVDGLLRFLQAKGATLSNVCLV